MNSQIHLTNFWCEGSGIPFSDIQPISLTQSIKPPKIVAVAKAKSTGYFVQTYSLEKKKTKTFQLSHLEEELLVKGEEYNIPSIDKSQRTNKFFMGLNIQNKYSRLLLIKTESENLSISFAVDFSDDKKLGTISCVTSFQIGNSDYVFCAGLNSLGVVKAKEKSMEHFYIFHDIVSGQLLDVALFKNKIFCAVKGQTTIVEICLSTAQVALDKGVDDEGFYENFEVSKIPICSAELFKLDINKKGNLLYAVGKGIIPVELNDRHGCPPKPHLESKFDSNLRISFHDG